MRGCLVVLLVGCNQVFGLEPTGLAPEIGSVIPARGVSAGGTQAAISGARLGDVDSVTFGGVPATIVSARDTEIDVTTPPHAAGLVDVEVASTAGRAIAPAAFEYETLALVQTETSFAIALPGVVSISATRPGDLLVVILSAGGSGSFTLATDRGLAPMFVDMLTWYRHALVYALPDVPGGDFTFTLTSSDAQSGQCDLFVAEYSGATSVYGFSGTKLDLIPIGTYPIRGLAVARRSPSDHVVVGMFASTYATFSSGTAMVATTNIDAAIGELAADVGPADVLGSVTFTTPQSSYAWGAVALGIAAQ